MTLLSSIAAQPSALILLTVFTFLGVFAGLSQNPDLTLSPASTVSSRQSKESLETKTEQFVVFFSQLFLKRDRTRVTIPFSYDTQEIPIIFFGFQPQPGTIRTEYLISHPQLLSLTWPALSQQHLRLYQQTPTFTQISDFLSSPPPLQSIVVDPILKDEFPQLKGARTTQEPFELETTSYILTTYFPSAFENEVFYYQNTLDATTADINSQSEIQWYLKVPFADTQHPYQLGNIAIDYLQ